jgi:urea transport system substrate-binding protein
MFYRLICSLSLLFLFSSVLIASDDSIKIGVLHSFSGTMQESERHVADAVVLAVDEINENGGVLGKDIEIVAADGRSDPKVFAKEAKRLIEQEKVKAIFGCWTSASRKAVKPIVEEYNNLLFYPVQYEGLEMSKNIFYTGMVANQQLFPAVKWASKNLGGRFYLVGSDYIFPRTANFILKDLAGFHSCTILGEKYIPLGGKDVKSIVDDIEKTKPSVIFNTINGDSNKYLNFRT